MDITASVGSVSTVPRHTADLRPAADALAIAHHPRPALPLGPATSQPPQSGQIAAISRALLESSDSSDFPPIEQPRRILKPWGIEMLPHRPQPAPQDAAAERGEVVTEGPGDEAEPEIDALPRANAAMPGLPGDGAEGSDKA